ncbi:MAG: HD-GYP domain-containing protein [Devosia sp.]
MTAGVPFLVSDSAHLQHALTVARQIGAPVVDLDAIGDVRTAPTVVFDVDIRARDVIAGVKAARRPKDQTWIFLLDAGTDLHAARTQAHALGASETIFRENAVTALSRRLSISPQYPVEGRNLAQLKARKEGAAVESAGRLLSSLFTAIGTDTAVSSAEVSRGAAILAESLSEVELGPWLDTVRHHHEGTFQHCLLVAATAASYARTFFVGEEQEALISAAILHDIGKADIPLHILDKPGGLSEAEFAIIARHPAIAHERLLGWGLSNTVLRAVRGHHEALDGTGYPDGLKGSQIQTVTRALTVCDVYAALSEARSYRPPMPREEAIAVLVDMALRGKLDYPAVRNMALLVGIQVPDTLGDVLENLRQVQAGAA